jgi:hypothetical protein
MEVKMTIAIVVTVSLLACIAYEDINSAK